MLCGGKRMYVIPRMMGTRDIGRNGLRICEIYCRLETWYLGHSILSRSNAQAICACCCLAVGARVIVGTKDVRPRLRLIRRESRAPPSGTDRNCPGALKLYHSWDRLMRLCNCRAKDSWYRADFISSKNPVHRRRNDTFTCGVFR